LHRVPCRLRLHIAVTYFSVRDEDIDKVLAYASSPLPSNRGTAEVVRQPDATLKVRLGYKIYVAGPTGERGPGFNWSLFLA
jgi:hypothetical protein